VFREGSTRALGHTAVCSFGFRRLFVFGNRRGGVALFGTHEGSACAGSGMWLAFGRDIGPVAATSSVGTGYLIGATSLPMPST